MLLLTIVKVAKFHNRSGLLHVHIIKWVRLHIHIIKWVWLHISLHAATAIKNFHKLVTYISSSNMDLVIPCMPTEKPDTNPISGHGSTYPAQTAKHIPKWWVWLHVSLLSVYNCISTNTIELVNL